MCEIFITKTVEKLVEIFLLKVTKRSKKRARGPSHKKASLSELEFIDTIFCLNFSLQKKGKHMSNFLVYRKQFKIPEAQHNFIEQSLDKWLRLSIVKQANSLYNLPIFCIPKKNKVKDS
jgi:hypothetical protein